MGYLFKESRFAPVFRLSATAVAGFALLRLALLFRAWPFIDHPARVWFPVFGMGLVYDMAFISYFAIFFVLVLFLFPRRWLVSKIFRGVEQGVSFLILYGLGFCFVAEWFFWTEFGVRFNFISVDYLVYRREVTHNILESYPVFWILPVIFVAAALVFRIVRPVPVQTLSVKEPWKRRIGTAAALLLIPLVAFLGLNQSQRSVSDNNYVNELASNGPYQLFAAFRNNTLNYRKFYPTGDDNQLSRMLKEEVTGENASSSPLYDIDRYVENPKESPRLNVILITVESLSAKFLSRFGQKENITPFMDGWFKQGKLFTNVYATGTRTTRGLEAITLSVPPTPGRSIVKRPDNAGMYTLGKVFQDRGYDTAFLYGGRGFFDNMNAFFSGNGYRIIDRTGLSHVTFENAWGACDEDIFNRTLVEADRDFSARKPFFFQIMTTSNHQPFTFPAGKIDLEPGEGGNGSGRAGGVKYTDYALKRLITQAKTRPWFKDTVFVVVADHCAASAGKIGLPVDKYHIPMFMYSPGHIAAGEVGRLASQIDLAPTLLALLNISYESHFFGQNILAKDFRERALIGNYQKLGLLRNNELLFLAPGRQIKQVTLLAQGPVMTDARPDDPGVQQLIAYYQGADYIIAHRLNRQSTHDSGIARATRDREF